MKQRRCAVCGQRKPANQFPRKENGQRLFTIGGRAAVVCLTCSRGEQLQEEVHDG